MAMELCQSWRMQQMIRYTPERQTLNRGRQHP